MVSAAGSKGGLSEVTKQKLAALRKTKVEKTMRPAASVEEQLPQLPAKTSEGGNERR